jgi:hypothetical protein
VDAAELSGLLETFLAARWGKGIIQRPRAMSGVLPWETADAVPEALRDMSWALFTDGGQPLAVGISDVGVHRRLRVFLLAYLRRCGRIELHHWSHDCASGWQYIKEQIPRIEGTARGLKGK